MLIAEIVGAMALIAFILTITRTCGPLGISWQLSYELWDAPCAPTVQERVDLWLRARRRLFSRAEHIFHVDRRAIAGVISYEALRDVHPTTFFSLTRSDGPGKVHFKDRYFSEGVPAAKQVELLGVLPQRTMSQRRQTLATDRGAIRYIAAIMSVLSRDASEAGYNIACHPETLATLYTGWSPFSANRLFAIRRFPENLRRNGAGVWVGRHLSEMQHDVGMPASEDCSARHHQPTDL